MKMQEEDPAGGGGKKVILHGWSNQTKQQKSTKSLERSDSVLASLGRLQRPSEGPVRPWVGTHVSQVAAMSTADTAGLCCPSLEAMVRELELPETPCNLSSPSIF